jgi:hypothetical protein
MTKFCVNCVHFERRGWDDDYCTRPLSDQRELVTGKLWDRVNRSCGSERRDGQTLFGRARCGTSARFFEAKA